MALRGCRRRNRASSDGLCGVGEAALGEGAQQVQRRRRLVVALQQPLGIRPPRRGGELDAVDDVATIARQLDAVDVSLGAERGLANWPAMRPTLITGKAAPKVSTTAICSSTRKVSRMLSARNSAKLSAQSPPWSRKALPSATSPSASVSRRASPAKTSGG